jgi:hypothetical protein
MIFEFFDGVHVPVSVRADAIPVPVSGSGRRAEFVNECLCGADLPDDALAPDGITPIAIISILHGRRISPILLMLRLFIPWALDAAPKLLEKRHESCNLGAIPAKFEPLLSTQI